MRRTSALLLVLSLSAAGCGGDGESADQSTATTITGVTQTSSAPTVEEPGSYGDDEAMDGLWDGCANGIWAACDALYIGSLPGSEYEAFGATCGDLTDGSNWCGLMMAPPEAVCVVQGCGPDTPMPEHNPDFEEFAGLLASGFDTRLGMMQLPGANPEPAYLGLRDEFGHEMQALYGAYGPSLGTPIGGSSDYLDGVDLENMSVSSMFMLVMGERQRVTRDQLVGGTGEGAG